MRGCEGASRCSRSRSPCCQNSSAIRPATWTHQSTQTFGRMVVSSRYYMYIVYPPIHFPLPLLKLWRYSPLLHRFIETFARFGENFICSHSIIFCTLSPDLFLYGPGFGGSAQVGGSHQSRPERGHHVGVLPADTWISKLETRNKTKLGTEPDQAPHQTKLGNILYIIMNLSKPATKLY